MGRSWFAPGLVLIALVATACGPAVEVIAPTATEPLQPPTSVPDPPGEAIAPDVDDTLGTSSAVRYPIEVGGRINSILTYDGIRPIYDPLFMPGDGARIMDANDLVIGLSLNGESRAYPVRTLRSREMVNDVVGGIPVLVTW